MYHVRNLIFIYTILNSSRWFFITELLGTIQLFKPIYVELSKVEANRNYAPSITGVYAVPDVKIQPDDKLVRVLLGVPSIYSPMQLDEICKHLGTTIAQKLETFFLEGQGKVISFNLFRMAACKLGNESTSVLPGYATYAVAQGFAQPELLSSQVTQTYLQFDQLYGIYVNRSFIKQIDAFDQILRHSFNPAFYAIAIANVSDSIETFSKFGTLFEVKATLLYQWSNEFYNNQSQLSMDTRDLFCAQLKEALRTVNGSQKVELLCALQAFLPVQINGTTYVRISAAFSTIGSTFVNTNSLRMTDILNNGMQSLATTPWFRIINNVQAIRKSQFYTCGINGNICSNHAYCLQQTNGISCVCALLFIDANPTVPGTDCRYSPTVIVVIVFPSVLLVCATVIITGFIIHQQSRRAQKYMIV